MPEGIVIEKGSKETFALGKYTLSNNQCTVYIIVAEALNGELETCHRAHPDPTPVLEFSDTPVFVAIWDLPNPPMYRRY